MSKRIAKEPEADKPNKDSLFPDFDTGLIPKRKYKRIEHPIWTENKAQFISSYLKYFVQITKHGVYIDGFAGPQSFHNPESWCASLVLSSEPRWLRKFYLFEKSAKGYEALRKLADAESDVFDKNGRPVSRRIQLFPGDFNRKVDQILRSSKVSQGEATFCLLDQRTFECEWDTVERLAAYKKAPQNKVEILYFLGVGWIHRAISGVHDEKVLRRWWGGKDWHIVKEKTAAELASTFRNRFELELGYKLAVPYPVFDSKYGNRIMYYMIHASDHEDAPALMVRAHGKAVRKPLKSFQQSLAL